MREILLLPSAFGHGEHDLFVKAPTDMAVDVAKGFVEEEIRRANKENAENEGGGCNDGRSVEDSIRSVLIKRGFEFFTPVQTMCWDEAHARAGDI